MAGNRKTPTPIVKGYTWDEIISEPGVYQPLEDSNYLMIVLKNHVGDPYEMILYNTTHSTFCILPQLHKWHNRKYTKSSLKLKLE